MTAWLDARALADLVHRGELRPVDLVEDAVARVEELNPTLNAVIIPDYERALEAARATDPALPFAGVPILLKDLCTEADGLRCCEGSAFLADHVSRGDQENVRRLRAAGFAILGKTNTPEFGMAPTTEPRLFGATANPWDVRHTTGGSSGGSAAAVASGMVPVAHGNDAGGSIRIPASACHLFGLKPTRGRNPLGPRYGDAFAGMVSEHVLTRTVRDSAALLDVTSGPDLGDPYSAPPGPGRWVDECVPEPGRLRIAVTTRTADGDPGHPEVVAVVAEACRLLTELGHDVFERDLTELDGRVGSAIGRMYGAATDWAIRYWVDELGRRPEPDELEPLTRLYWERGQRVSGGELLMAITTIQRFTRRLAEATAGFDLWLSPTLAEPPPRLGEMAADDADPTVAEARAARFVAYPLVVANLTGRAAMSVPFGWSASGLPIGVHFLGTYGGEATLLRLAAQLEQARPWADRRPSTAVAAAEAVAPG
ncbi:amidase [Nocardioides ginsengisoli]|uniref:Amidase n=1 Tax=Nocardioides ginsengisoli TaxID=363868 RepID=A0ABW3W1P0_9ACTN